MLIGRQIPNRPGLHRQLIGRPMISPRTVWLGGMPCPSSVTGKTSTTSGGVPRRTRSSRSRQTRTTHANSPRKSSRQAASIGLKFHTAWSSGSGQQRRCVGCAPQKPFFVRQTKLHRSKGAWEAMRELHSVVMAAAFLAGVMLLAASAAEVLAQETISPLIARVEGRQ
jgi:hypothetical protein